MYFGNSIFPTQWDQLYFWRPMDVYMKSGLHIDVYWTYKGRLVEYKGKEYKNNRV